jgi:hypothetical protein
LHSNKTLDLDVKRIEFYYYFQILNLNFEKSIKTICLERKKESKECKRKVKNLKQYRK